MERLEQLVDCHGNGNGNNKRHRLADLPTTILQMQLSFTQVVSLLGFVSAIQAGNNPYSRKSTKHRQQVGQVVQQQIERPNGRQVSTPNKQVKQPSKPNTRKDEVAKPASGAIYGRKDVYKGGKPKAGYSPQQAKAAGQFGPVQPGLALGQQEDRPGFAWQQRTITVTVTRGFARSTITVSTEEPRTFTETSTALYESTSTETVNVTEDATTTNFATYTTTETVTTYVGPVSTIEETTTTDFTPTETTTSTFENETVVTEPTTFTAWETNTSTEVEYSPVTVTSDIPFSTTTVVTPLVTVFETVQGDVVTITVTEPVEVTAYTTVQDVFTATEIEIAYETPAYMRY